MRVLIGKSDINFGCEVLGINRVVSKLNEYEKYTIEQIQYDSYEEFAEKSSMLNEYAVAILTIGIHFLEDIVKVAKFIKQRASQTKIIIVYPYALSPEEIFIEGCEIDYVLLGNAEMLIDDLLRLIEEKSDSTISIHPNIWVNGEDNHNKRAFITQHSNLPLPKLTISDFKRNGYATIQSSSGCKSNCSFCLSKMTNKRWSGIEPEIVANEIKEIYKTFRVSHFVFSDRSFEDSNDNNKKRLEMFCTHLSNVPVTLTYRCYLRAESIRTQQDIEILSKMQDVGFSNVFIGIEAFTEEELTFFNKRATVADNYRILDICKSMGFFTEIGNIMFHPLTTPNTLITNFNALIENEIFSLYSYFAVLYIYNNTMLYNKIKSILPNYNYKKPLDYKIIDKDANDIFNFILEHMLKTELHIQADLAKKYLYNINYWFFILERELSYDIYPKKERINESQKRMINIIYDYFYSLYVKMDFKYALQKISDFESNLFNEYRLVKSVLMQIYHDVHINLKDKYRIY